ncbi:hypothetical protein [Streptomyces sp.]|uniref:hypothetical protein n=1 Tax=Streptomyces sp. TaxID=1931 RepID=UPI002D77E235|nr:hypothetical protein [Streptomyces sp.]HET6356052.1 hypothetical protein [Streptomyces sp.]
MPTGPEHYRAAERLLAESRTELRPNDEGPCEADRTIAEAQVHATLALAAATALSEPSRSAPRATVPEWNAWHSAAGVRPPQCTECTATVEPGHAYCSTACRNAADRHDTPETEAVDA